VLLITCVFNDIKLFVLRTGGLKKLKSLFLHKTLPSDHSLESSFQDDSNISGNSIGFGEEIKKLCRVCSVPMLIWSAGQC